jgi:hypothetical protein
VCRNHRVTFLGIYTIEPARAGPFASGLDQSLGHGLRHAHPLARARSVLRSHRERAIAHADDREIRLIAHAE